MNCFFEGIFYLCKWNLESGWQFVWNHHSNNFNQLETLIEPSPFGYGPDIPFRIYTKYISDTNFLEKIPFQRCEMVTLSTIECFAWHLHVKWNVFQAFSAQFFTYFSSMHSGKFSMCVNTCMYYVPYSMFGVPNSIKFNLLLAMHWHWLGKLGNSFLLFPKHTNSICADDEKKIFQKKICLKLQHSELIAFA